MPSDCFRARRTAIVALIGAAIGLVAGLGDARAQIGPQAVVLIDRLCAQSLRTNEEDRLYGMISLAVRATIRYRGGEFRPDLIDDAVQDSLDGMIEDCPELTEADQSKRLTMAVEMISDATTKVLDEAAAAKRSGDKDNPYNKPLPDKLTAADLSQELSTPEIDQWLESQPPRQRALSLFLYASDVTPQDIAAAIGEPAGALTRQAAASKNDLMRLYREDWGDRPSGGRTPAMMYRETGGAGIAALMKASAGPAPAPAPAASTDDPAAPLPAPRADGVLPALQVTGISNDLYAGWSLLATGRNLPRGQRLSISEPFVLQPDGQGIKRMVVTDIAEIGDPNAPVRHFLLKAYAIDAEADAAGLRDTFHVGPVVDNEEAKKTLANNSLSSIEVARCLWHDYGTGQDPGLCR
jgi:DNA-directed RNA polymerase specialized sigma24 family protein